MSASAPERQATAFSGTVAVLVAALAGLALGADGGAAAAVVGSLVGAVAVALGVRALQAEANARKAVGSVGVVAGTLAFAGVAALGGGVVPLFVGIAVAAAAINATVSLDSDVDRPVGHAVWRSATVLAVGTVVATGAYVGAFGAIAGGAFAGLSAVVAVHDLARLVALQVGLLAVVELLHWAVPILDQWLPEERDLRAAVFERFDYRIEDVPRAYWAFFGLQVVLALTSWGPRWFDAFLGSLSLFGDAIALLLRSGVLHGPLAAILAILAAILVGRAAQLVVVAWAGTDPPGALSHAAGGIAIFVAAALLAASPLAGALAAVAGSDVADLFGAVGATAALTGTVAAALFGVAVARAVLGNAVRPWVATDAANGFAVASAALVVAALVASHDGASALAVFAAIGAALVVLDLGTNAVELGTQVGRLAETRAGEATHAVGSLLVAAGGVALATLTAFVMGSASFSVPTWRARLAVALALVAVLCFAVLLGRE